MYSHSFLFIALRRYDRYRGLFTRNHTQLSFICKYTWHELLSNIALNTLLFSSN